MPLQVPNLDDRNYTDLVQEALSMLPQYAPEWTNHNPSDPGITLVELLAYFTEMLIYRLNRITRENKIKFLQLLREVTPDEKKRLVHATVAEVDEQLRQTVLALRQPQRAVTGEDYESVIKIQTAHDRWGQRVLRVRCFTRKNLETLDNESRAFDRPGHVSVVIVPESDVGPQTFAALLEDLRKKLEPVRLLTTRLHVVGPYYLWVTLDASIRPYQDVSFAEVSNKAIEKLQQYFNPLPGGGPNGEGWPFGRAIYLSEISALLEKIEGVDSVQEVRILRLAATGEALDDERSAVGVQVGVTSTVGIDSRLGCETPGDTERLLRDALGRVSAVTLAPYELVKTKIFIRKKELSSTGSSLRTQSSGTLNGGH